MNCIVPIVAKVGEKPIVVWLDPPKVAVPVGTAPELQLAAVLQSLDAGVAPHVASCASLGCGMSIAPNASVDIATVARARARNPS